MVISIKKKGLTDYSVYKIKNEKERTIIVLIILPLLSLILCMLKIVKILKAKLYIGCTVIFNINK